MSSFSHAVTTWARERLSAADVIYLADCTGAVEGWLRGQLLLAVRDGLLGDVRHVSAERDGLVDILIDEHAAELKVVFNNKNFLGRGTTGVVGVRQDLAKLRRRTAGEKVAVVFFVFYDRRVVTLSEHFHRTTAGIGLQPQPRDVFSTFAMDLARDFVRRVLDDEPPVDAVLALGASPDTTGKWLGAWVYDATS